MKLELPQYSKGPHYSDQAFTFPSDNIKKREELRTSIVAQHEIRGAIIRGIDVAGCIVQ